MRGKREEWERERGRVREGKGKSERGKGRMREEKKEKSRAREKERTKKREGRSFEDTKDANCITFKSLLLSHLTPVFFLFLPFLSSFSLLLSLSSIKLVFNIFHEQKEHFIPSDVSSLSLRHFSYSFIPFSFILSHPSSLSLFLIFSHPFSLSLIHSFLSLTFSLIISRDFDSSLTDSFFSSFCFNSSLLNSLFFTQR